MEDTLQLFGTRMGKYGLRMGWWTIFDGTGLLLSTLLTVYQVDGMDNQYVRVRSGIVKYNGRWDYIGRVGKMAVGYQRYNDCTLG